MTFQKIGVIGAGSWGTALALVAARAGRDVVLWARSNEHVLSMTSGLENSRYLPGVMLPGSMLVTADPSEFQHVDAILLVVPAQAVRSVSMLFADVLPGDCPVVICSKGIEHSTGLLMSEVLAQTLAGRSIAVLSGPTFAKEVARDLPTAVTLACKTVTIAQALCQSLATHEFRPYASGDVIGVEVAGALKNVIAIACGIVHGRELGENSRASLITRGLAEMSRLVVAKQGFSPTLMGLGGVGDLMLTCSTDMSRNFAFGQEIGRGLSISATMARSDIVVEGAFTARAIPDLASGLGIDMPICAAVEVVLYQGADLDETIESMLSRPLKNEQF